MKKVASLLLCLFICCGLPNLTVSALEQPFKVEFSINEPVYVNDTVVVQIKVSNITVPLAAVQFSLHFDDTFLTPVITENENDEMNAFIKKSPNSRWEQVSRYDNDLSIYFLRFLTDDEDNLLQNPDDFLIEIPFTAKKEGATFLAIEDSSVIAADLSMKTILGKGCEKVFTIISTDKIKPKDSSNLNIYTSGENVYITGIREKTPVSDLLNSFINTGLTLLDADGNPYTKKFCGTGMKICLFDGDTLLDSITLVVKGDLDGDGTVSPIDYLYMRKFLLHNLALNETQQQAGLLQNSTSITALTVLKLKKHYLGYYDIYEV